jgi:hypothetical protein
MHPNTLQFLKFLREQLESASLTPQLLYDTFTDQEKLSWRDRRDLAASLADELGFTGIVVPPKPNSLEAAAIEAAGKGQTEKV